MFCVHEEILGTDVMNAHLFTSFGQQKGPGKLVSQLVPLNPQLWTHCYLLMGLFSASDFLPCLRNRN